MERLDALDESAMGSFKEFCFEKEGFLVFVGEKTLVSLLVALHRN